MTDAAPDSAAALTLTFWAHTDTSFGGYLRVGPPVSVGGGAYGWHDDGALQIATVSNAGDTVIWTSRAVDTLIGGHYRVTGGPHDGQAGTWRARLQRGSAATQASLRKRDRTAVTMGAVLGAVAVLVLVLAVARWIRREPLPPLPPQGDAWSAFARLRCISGFLAWFLIGQSVAPVIALARLPAATDMIRDSWPLGALSPLMHPLLVLELVFHVAQVIVPLGGVFLIIKRSRFAPRYWFAYLAVLALYAVVDIGGAAIFSDQLAHYVPTDASSNAEQAGARSSNLRLLLWSAVWALYWLRSERVRATFGSTALPSRTARASVLPSLAEPS
jgi:hypothetical protein